MNTKVNVIFVRYTQRDLWVKDGACYRHTLTTDHATNMRTWTVAAATRLRPFCCVGLGTSLC